MAATVSAARQDADAEGLEWAAVCPAAAETALCCTKDC